MRESIKPFKKAAGLAPVMFAVALTLFCPLQKAFAEGRVYGGIDEKCLEFEDWFYFDRGDHICICGYGGLDESITVPSEINGKKVTEISRRTKPILNGITSVFFDSINTTTKEVIVPEGVKFIDDGTFSSGGSHGIEKITLPESLEEIGACAFYGCEALKTIQIPKNVKTIGGSAFESSGLEEVTLYEGLRIINGSAFSSTPLKAVNIPSTVIQIGGYAFYSTEIEEIILPKNLTVLEANVFDGCKKLKKACINEGTAVLETSIFANCPSLEEVYFPSTLTSVSKIFNTKTKRLKSLHFAADESACSVLLSGSVWNSMFDCTSENGLGINAAYEAYKSLNITYNTPVPEHMPVIEPGEIRWLKGDNGVFIFIIITALGFLCTLIFLCILIKAGKQAAKKKTEGGERNKEGFQPEVLGVWYCERCGTANSSIANYCYHCGRKRQD